MEPHGAWQGLHEQLCSVQKDVRGHGECYMIDYDSMAHWGWNQHVTHVPTQSSIHLHIGNHQANHCLQSPAFSRAKTALQAPIRLAWDTPSASASFSRRSWGIKPVNSVQQTHRLFLDPSVVVETMLNMILRDFNFLSTNSEREDVSSVRHVSSVVPVRCKPKALLYIPKRSMGLPYMPSLTPLAPPQLIGIYTVYIYIYGVFGYC